MARVRKAEGGALNAHSSETGIAIDDINDMFCRNIHEYEASQKNEISGKGAEVE